MPARPDTTFPIETEPGFALHSDPDQTTVDVEVDLPMPGDRGRAARRRCGPSILDSMIYDSLIRRLDQDVSAGTAPFDEIVPGTNSFVASLDAPALYAITDADRVDATLQALLDEYERADRFGFTASRGRGRQGVGAVRVRLAVRRARHHPGRRLRRRSTSANFLTGDAVPDGRRPVRDRHGR